MNGDGGHDASAGGGTGAACARDADVPFTLPAPTPGWQDERDGITCEHPAVQTDCVDGWCRIPAGCFVMGSPEDEWSRGSYTEELTATTLTHPFVIQQTESTRTNWEALGLPAPGVARDYGADCTDPDCPAGNVSWFGALAFANLLSEHEGFEACYELSGCSGSLQDQSLTCEIATSTAPTLYECEGYRLPTEAEWEYAARAGTRTAVCSGDITAQPGVTSCGPDPNLEPIAWYCYTTCGLNVTHPVARKLANQWGLFDTSGNALEWTTDSTEADPGPAPWTDPVGAIEPSSNYVRKGGNAWGANALLRSASRTYGSAPNDSGPSLGLRLVRTLFE